MAKKTKEVDDLYGLPHFTEDERHLYFELSTAEREVVAAVRTVSVAVHLTLQYYAELVKFYLSSVYPHPRLILML